MPPDRYPEKKAAPETKKRLSLYGCGAFRLYYFKASVKNNLSFLSPYVLCRLPIAPLPGRHLVAAGSRTPLERGRRVATRDEVASAPPLLPSKWNKNRATLYRFAPRHFVFPLHTWRLCVCPAFSSGHESVRSAVHSFQARLKMEALEGRLLMAMKRVETN